jgi:hypothetical protein
MRARNFPFNFNSAVYYPSLHTKCTFVVAVYLFIEKARLNFSLFELKDGAFFANWQQ